MFCVMLMSWWLGGPLEYMGQVKLYLIHTSSHRCLCKLKLDFKVDLQVEICENWLLFKHCLVVGLEINGYLIFHINSYSTYCFDVTDLVHCFKHSHDAAECDSVSWHLSFFTAHTSPYPSPFSKGHGHGTLISPYPLYPSDCPTLTPPRLSVFALALHRTSVTAPATAARSLHSPIPPQVC